MGFKRATIAGVLLMALLSACTAPVVRQGPPRGPDTERGEQIEEPTRGNVAAPAKRSVAPAVVMAALAAGGIGSGIGLAVVSSSNNSHAAALRAYIAARSGTCIPNVGGYDSKCPQLQSDANAYVTFRDAAVGAFVAGGVAAAGTALYLLWPSPRPKTAGPSVARDVRLTPILGPTGNGLLVSGQF